MREKLSSVDEYLEKAAGAAAFGDVIKGLAGRLWKDPLGRAAIIGLPTIAAGSALFHGFGGGGITEGKRQGDTLSYRINKELNSLTDRIRADEVAGDSFAKAIGGETAKQLLGLTTDMASKTYNNLHDTFVTSPLRRSILDSLKREDPILGEADNKTLLEAFHTMKSVAPTLSTDKNAVRSFLTQAVVSGGGLDYHTIKGIADAESAVANAKNGGKR